MIRDTKTLIRVLGRRRPSVVCGDNSRSDETLLDGDRVEICYPDGDTLSITDKIIRNISVEVWTVRVGGVVTLASWD